MPEGEWKMHDQKAKWNKRANHSDEGLTNKNRERMVQLVLKKSQEDDKKSTRQALNWTTRRFLWAGCSQISRFTAPRERPWSDRCRRTWDFQRRSWTFKMNARVDPIIIRRAPNNRDDNHRQPVAVKEASQVDPGQREENGVMKSSWPRSVLPGNMNLPLSRSKHAGRIDTENELQKEHSGTFPEPRGNSLEKQFSDLEPEGLSRRFP